MRSLGVSILLIGLLCLPLAARAGTSLRVASPGPVTGGAVVRTTVPALPAGAHEFELVLVLDDGSAMAVSPELPAGVTTVAWRVPNVSVRGARLQVRVGGERWERALASSEAFVIRADAQRPLGDRFAVAWSPGPSGAWMSERPGASFDPLASDDDALVEPDDASPDAPVTTTNGFEPARDPYAAPDGTARTPSNPSRTTSLCLRI